MESDRRVQVVYSHQFSTKTPDKDVLACDSETAIGQVTGPTRLTSWLPSSHHPGAQFVKNHSGEANRGQLHMSSQPSRAQQGPKYNNNNNNHSVGHRESLSTLSPFLPGSKPDSGKDIMYIPQQPSAGYPHQFGHQQSGPVHPVVWQAPVRHSEVPVPFYRNGAPEGLHRNELMSVHHNGMPVTVQHNGRPGSALFRKGPPVVLAPGATAPSNLPRGHHVRNRFGHQHGNSMNQVVALHPSKMNTAQKSFPISNQSICNAAVANSMPGNSLLSRSQVPTDCAQEVIRVAGPLPSSHVTECHDIEQGCSQNGPGVAVDSHKVVPIPRIRAATAVTAAERAVHRRPQTAPSHLVPVVTNRSPLDPTAYVLVNTGMQQPPPPYYVRAEHSDQYFAVDPYSGGVITNETRNVMSSQNVVLRKQQDPRLRHFGISDGNNKAQQLRRHDHHVQATLLGSLDLPIVLDADTSTSHLQCRHGVERRHASEPISQANCTTAQGSGNPTSTESHNSTPPQDSAPLQSTAAHSERQGKHHRHGKRSKKRPRNLTTFTQSCPVDVVWSALPEYPSSSSSSENAERKSTFEERHFAQCPPTEGNSCTKENEGAVQTAQASKLSVEVPSLSELDCNSLMHIITVVADEAESSTGLVNHFPTPPIATAAGQSVGVPYVQGWNVLSDALYRTAMPPVGLISSTIPVGLSHVTAPSIPPQVNRLMCDRPSLVPAFSSDTMNRREEANSGILLLQQSEKRGDVAACQPGESISSEFQTSCESNDPHCVSDRKSKSEDSSSKNCQSSDDNTTNSSLSRSPPPLIPLSAILKDPSILREHGSLPHRHKQDRCSEAAQRTHSNRTRSDPQSGNSCLSPKKRPLSSRQVSLTDPDSVVASSVESKRIENRHQSSFKKDCAPKRLLSLRSQSLQLSSSSNSLQVVQPSIVRQTECEVVIAKGEGIPPAKLMAFMTALNTEQSKPSSHSGQSSKMRKVQPSELGAPLISKCDESLQSNECRRSGRTRKLPLHSFV